MNKQELENLEKFQDETALVPYIVAGRHLADFSDRRVPQASHREFFTWLEDFERLVELKTARLWASPWYRKRLKARGQEYYEMFVRHWAGAYLLYRRRGVDWLARLRGN